MAERQSARMSKITNDSLTRSGIGLSHQLLCPHGNSGRQRVMLRSTSLEIRPPFSARIQKLLADLRLHSARLRCI